MQTEKSLRVDSSAHYLIRVQGYLGENWSERLGGVKIQPQSQADGSPITALEGEFRDQAALAGVLNTLYDLGLPLLSVTCFEFGPNPPAN